MARRQVHGPTLAALPLQEAQLLPAALILLAALLLLAGCGREFENPSDPEAPRFEVASRAFLQRLDTANLIEGDTIRMVGGITSRPVEDDSLVIRHDWDLNGDGDIDTTVYRTDTLAWVAGASGTRQARLVLTDRAGNRDMAEARFRVHPELARVFRLKGYDSGIKGYDSDCPAYAQEPLLMRLALALSHFSVEKTREEGLRSTEFALKLAQAVTGSAFPIGLLADFDYSFSRGVYRFRAEDFSLDVAFHYGPGLAGHAEGDTIRQNLFSLDSYVRDIRVTGFPPEIRYARGPLADLIDGSIEVDWDDPLDPKFDFEVGFNRIRMSFSRANRTLLVLSNAEITLANSLFFTLYEGRARMAPLYPPEILRRYGQDSLELDFAGTTLRSPVVPIVWTYVEDGTRDSAVYRLALVQETLRQTLRFGDAGGLRKALGEYAAVNRLGEDGELEAVYFRGGYSSVEADSARFYCREAMEDGQYFGSAAFETPVEGRGNFASSRYGYSFGFPFTASGAWNGDSDALPPTLRALMK